MLVADEHIDRATKELARNIGRRVAELRRGTGETQERFAERYGASVQWVRRIETGMEQPSLPTLAKLAVVLDVSVVDLFSPAQSKERSKPGRPRKSRR